MLLQTRGGGGGGGDSTSAERVTSFIDNKHWNRDQSITYVQSECSYRRAEEEEEEEVQRRPSACPQ
jgi:hypothetical protein